MNGIPQSPENPGTQEIMNHIMAWTYPQIFCPPWTTKTVRTIHRVLLEDAEPSAIPGEFRTHDSAIFEDGEEVFITSPPQHIEEELQALLDWVNDFGPAYAPIITATVFFHQFESIHPFEDGNGRVGRTFFHQYLQQRGLRNAHLCLIEPELVGRKELYYSLLAFTDYTSSYTQLIDYFADAILKAYRTAEQTLRSKD